VGDCVWVTVWVTLRGLWCVGDDVGDDMWVTVGDGMWVTLCDGDQKKKERQRQKPNSGKLGIRRDDSRRRTEMKFCMVGGLQMIVLRFEFHQNRLSGFGGVGWKFAHRH